MSADHHPSLEQAVRESLATLQIQGGDAAAVTLALRYAMAIDQVPEMIGKHGPQLLVCLEALLMTPRARLAAVKRTQDERASGNPLDELRARRARRSG